MSKNIKLLVSIAGLLLSPATIYYGVIFANGLSQMAVSVTTGQLPPPIPRPPKFLRENRLYGPLVQLGDVMAQEQAREYQQYLKTGKHPLAMFPPSGFRKDSK